MKHPTILFSVSTKKCLLLATLLSLVLMTLGCQAVCEVPVRTEQAMSVTTHHLNFSECQGKVTFKDQVGGEHRMIYSWQAKQGEKFSLSFKSSAGQAAMHLEVNGRSVGVGSSSSTVTTNFSAPMDGTSVEITVTAHPDDRFVLTLKRK